MPSLARWVYFFGPGRADGSAAMRDILGGKGAGLAEMANLGLPVPPGFTISAKLCLTYLEQGTFPDQLHDEVARHLTLHGTNWDSEGCLTWKFDNYARAIGPFGHNLADTSEIYGQITSPTLLFWGLESFAPVPKNDPRVAAMQHCRLIKVPKAGHWVHHDQLDLFLKETTEFLAE